MELWQKNQISKYLKTVLFTAIEITLNRSLSPQKSRLNWESFYPRDSSHISHKYGQLTAFKETEFFLSMVQSVFLTNIIMRKALFFSVV